MNAKRLQPGEFDYLLDRIEQGRSGIRDGLVCCMLHDSAMRIDDALTVQLDHFSPDRSLVQIHEGKWRKAGEVDTLPVSPRTIERIHAYLSVRPHREEGPLILSDTGSMMYQQHYRRLLAREGQRWLGKHVHPHMLRATAISEAAFGIKGVREPLPLPVVQRFARHKNLATTSVYIHSLDDQWARDMRDWMAG